MSGPCAAGQAGRVLTRQREGAGFGVVLDDAADRQSGEPLAHVALVEAGRRRDLGARAGLAGRHGVEQAYLVADADQQREHATVEHSEHATGELLGLRHVDLACRHLSSFWVDRYEAMGRPPAAHRYRYPICALRLRNSVCVGPGGCSCSSRASRGADLRVDVRNVPLDGAHREHELVCDRLVREPCCDETQDLGFSRRQRAGRRRTGAGTERSERLVGCRVRLPCALCSTCATERRRELGTCERAVVLRARRVEQVSGVLEQRRRPRVLAGGSGDAPLGEQRRRPQRGVRGRGRDGCDLIGCPAGGDGSARASDARTTSSRPAIRS